MNEFEAFSEKLKQSLLKDLGEVEVSAARGDFHKILGFVVSPRFEGMDEGDRQEIIWRQVLDQFSPAEQDRIEFIYTDAPSEVAS